MPTLTADPLRTVSPDADRQRSRRRRRKAVEPLLYLAPAFIVLALIIGYPLLDVVRTSFMSSSLIRPGQDRFTGLDNFATLFSDPTFWTVTARTAVWAVSAWLLQITLGLGIAHVLAKKIFARGFVRTTMILPWVVPGVLAALIWRFMLDPVQGPVNELLKATGLLDNPPLWLANTSTVLPVLILIGAWKWTPFTVVILLAGLQQIPHEQHEAAMMDGASPWQRLWHVTIPGLRTSLALCSLTAISGAINNFNGIWLFTQGGPAGASEILTTYAYRTAFVGFDFGAAGAISMVIFAVMMVLATVYFYVVEGRKR
ncbi:sugar ABC transporter permease [Georgenia sp. H159]|uniref:carbohydrate ABC transporter permease n=1 Tax=Georgenia sp. H159 TaxID=3076115 RepID=UPI002D78D330|nr:sugar ABC transporter permease [Georgenia sp. H159]